MQSSAGYAGAFLNSARQTAEKYPEVFNLDRAMHTMASYRLLSQSNCASIKKMACLAEGVGDTAWSAIGSAMWSGVAHCSGMDLANAPHESHDRRGAYGGGGPSRKGCDTGSARTSSSSASPPPPPSSQNLFATGLLNALATATAAASATALEQGRAGSPSCQ